MDFTQSRVMKVRVTATVELLIVASTVESHELKSDSFSEKLCFILQLLTKDIEGAVCRI